MSPNKQRINMMIDEDLLKQLDDLSNEIGKSRSAIMCDLIRQGIKQVMATKKYFGNRHLLRILNWLFGLSSHTSDDAALELDSQDERVDVARNLILKEMKKLSLLAAEKEFDAETGTKVDLNGNAGDERTGGIKG